MYDLVIKNGTVVDGTRTPRYRADLGISGGRIVKIGDIDPAGAREVLDAAGRIVGPGFVDPHTHFDAQIFWDPTCADSGQNGATTVISGNCGFGFAPCRPAERERTMAMMQTTEQVPLVQMQTGLPWNWETFPEFLNSIDSVPKAVNISVYMPLNPLLVYVMGLDAAKTRRPTDQEMGRIKHLLGEGMDAGAQGVAFVRLGELDSHTDFDGSLMPSDVLDPEDAAEIAAVIGARDQGVVMCLTQVGQMGAPEISEKVARQTGRRPMIHNVIMSSETTPDLHRQGLAWLADLRAQGLNIWGQAILSRSWQECDVWHLGGTTLDFMPIAREFISGSRTFEQKMAKAADQDYRRRFRENYDERVAEVFGSSLADNILVAMGPNGNSGDDRGLTFAEIGAKRGVDFVDAFFDIAIASAMDFTFREPHGPAVDPVKIVELISDPHVLGGVSDGGAHSKITSGGTWATDLLIWLAREQGLASLEDLHHHLSAVPCEVFGLAQRGTIREGNFADLLVYDLNELHFDRSSYDVAYDMAGGDWRRKARAGGYRWIIVNGAVTFENDVRRSSVPGRLLRIGQPDVAEKARPFA